MRRTASRRPRSVPGRAAPPTALLLALAWVAYFGVLQWSVVRFRISIVLTLTVTAALLAWWLLARAKVVLDSGALAVGVLGSVPITLAVPLFSYVPDRIELRLRLLEALTALVCAITLVLLRRPTLAWACAVISYAVVGAAVIRADPAPRIDVWVTLQQAADALVDGVNFYSVTWTGSPGVKDAFTYLPWSAVLLAPGRLVAGDVRWMMLVWMLLAAVGLLLIGRTNTAEGVAARTCDAVVRANAVAGQSNEVAVQASGVAGQTDCAVVDTAAEATDRARWTAAAVTALVLLAPGTLTQVDQAWTEPLLFAALVWWALLLVRDRPWWAVIPLALACASKQHLVLLLLVLLVWRPFGVAKVMATGALTSLLIAPWFVTAPADFVHDTLTFLIDFHPIRFANTWYLLALNTWGIAPPFWMTGVIVAGTLALAMLTIRRHDPPLGTVLRWSALVLLVANLVNKQAFYNQYWLVAAIVGLSLVVDAATLTHRLTDRFTPPPDDRADSVVPEPRPRPAG
ncbi:MAG: hypothetical protein V9G19_04860 [Tetrasphaera sp.]